MNSQVFSRLPIRIALAMLAALLSAASTASAHNGPLVRVGPSQALPGQQVSVAVSGVPADTDVQLRWATVDGIVLATAPAPSLRATITVPEQAGPDVYYVRAMQDGQLMASGAIEVMAASPTPASPTPASPTPASAAPAAAVVQPPADRPAPPASSTETAAPQISIPGPKTVSTAKPVTLSRAPARRSPARPAPAARVDAPSRISRPTTPATDEPSRTVAAATRSRSAHQMRGRPRRSTRPKLVTTRAKLVPPVSDMASRSSGEMVSLSSHRSSATAQGPSDGWRLGIGAALLGLGLVASLGGFLVADTRRRRAKAGA